MDAALEEDLYHHNKTTHVMTMWIAGQLLDHVAIEAQTPAYIHFSPSSIIQLQSL